MELLHSGRFGFVTETTFTLALSALVYHYCTYAPQLIFQIVSSLTGYTNTKILNKFYSEVSAPKFFLLFSKI